MSNCCNPVIPPACARKCKQRYDACCVTDEQALPCIFDPIDVLASGVIGQDWIVVDDASGIVEGMGVTGDGIGLGAVVTGIDGTTVALSVENIKTFPAVAASDEVQFNLINNAQCDINEAINDILCDLKSGGIPCLKTDDFNTATLNDPIFPLTWTATSPVQYSDPIQCQVRLRGTATTTIDATIANHVNTQLFIIPAGPSRPAIDKVFSVNVLVDATTIQSYTRYVPAILTIVASTGVVLLSFSDYNPLVPIASGCADCAIGVPVASYQRAFTDDKRPETILQLFISLDGLTYEIAA